MKNLCNNCPRRCNVDRSKTLGFCRANEKVKVAKIMLHHWEEPIISGKEQDKGSGAIFFSNCNLKCVYCQNYEISNCGVGKEISIQELANIFKKMEDNGALNINLVTPTQYTDQIISALNIYKPKIPVVWNTSGYETVENIKKIKPYVDIYLADYKYSNSVLAGELSGAINYPKEAERAILEMRKNQPKDIIKNGIMQKGLIVRHLCLPKYVENSFSCLDFIEKNLGKNTIVSLMGQYTPCYKAKDRNDINRKLNPIEYKRVLLHAEKLGLNNGYFQSLDSSAKEYIPNFKIFDEME